MDYYLLASNHVMWIVEYGDKQITVARPPNKIKQFHVQWVMDKDLVLEV